MKLIPTDVIYAQMAALLLLEVILLGLLRRVPLVHPGYVLAGVAIGVAASLPTCLLIIYLLRHEAERG